MSFLIFACPKSGTTWLQRLVSQHPQAVCAESRAFGDYFDPHSLSRPHLTLEAYLGILSHYLAPAVGALGPGATSFYRTLLFNFLDTLATTTLGVVGKPVYGEKLTPYRGTAEHALTVLAEYHPGIKFVNLTRDGRDVIVSGTVQWLNDRARRAAPTERVAFERALKDHTLPAAEFEMFLEYWTDSVRAGLKARGRFRHYLHLSYEQLITDPEFQIKTLFEFLDLGASPDVVNSCVQATEFERLSGGRPRGQEDQTSLFRKGVAGDWKTWFTASQRERFNQQAGDLLSELGYTSCAAEV
jgi:Sulfotransferase domain